MFNPYEVSGFAATSNWPIFLQHVMGLIFMRNYVIVFRSQQVKIRLAFRFSSLSNNVRVIKWWVASKVYVRNHNNLRVSYVSQTLCDHDRRIKFVRATVRNSEILRAHYEIQMYAKGDHNSIQNRLATSRSLNKLAITIHFLPFTNALSPSASDWSLCVRLSKRACVRCSLQTLSDENDSSVYFKKRKSTDSQEIFYKTISWW